MKTEEEDMNEQRNTFKTTSPSCTSRAVLDQKLQRLRNLKKDETDITHGLVIVLFILHILTSLGGIIQKNSAFLTSQTGYMNGRTVHQYFTEIVEIKEHLSKGNTNFWFHGNSLGYPLLTTSSPLPKFLAAVIMLLTERLVGVSSLCFIRLFITILVMVVPITWYQGSRQLDLTRTQSLLVSLSVLLCESQFQNGFELNEYLIEGNLSQLFSHLLFPLAVAKMYKYGYIGSSKESPFYLLCLTYLCSAFTGFYCSIVYLFIHVSALIVKKSVGSFKSNLNALLWMHVKLGICLAWLIVPLLLSYPYVGGIQQSFYGGFVAPDALEMFTSGTLFDFNKSHCLFTIFVVFGIGFCVLKLVLSLNHFYKKIPLSSDAMFSLWLLVLTFSTFILYSSNRFVTNMLCCISMNVKCDKSFFIIGVQSCGVFLMGLALDVMCALPTYLPIVKKWKTKFLKKCVTLVVALILLKANADRISGKTSLVETSSHFMNALRDVKEHGKSEKLSVGRILLNSRLGTGGSWDMLNIPSEIGKPGAMSVSRGYQNSLSVFYIDAIPFGLTNPQNLKRFLKLYNIHYLALSNAFMDSVLSDVHHFNVISRTDDMVFLKVLHDRPGSGYIEFVHIPGYIDGNLNNVRETVLETLPLYESNVLMYLNPRQGSEVRENAILNVKVKKISRQNDVSLVTWKLNNEGMNSENVIDDIRESFNEDDEEVEIKSTVVEEFSNGVEYHVLVNVVEGDDSKVAFKMSYHPFWRCVYFPVDGEYSLPTSDHPILVPRNRTSAIIDHVTPNFMAVTLPAGRYHVIFRYRFPGILKIMAVVFVTMFLNNWLNLHLFSRLWNMSILIYSRIEMFQRNLLFALVSLVNLLYYQSVEIDVEPVVQKLSTMSFKPNLIYKPSRLRQFSSLVFCQCKEKFRLSHNNLMRIIQKKKIKNVDINKNFEEQFEKKTPNIQNSIPQKKSPPVPFVKKSPEMIVEHNLSDHDSSFSYDGLVYRSPPTPPKHTKKSYRKRHSRMQQNSCGGGDHSSRKSTPVLSRRSPDTGDVLLKDNDDSEVFQTSGRKTSPVLGSIINSLRRNSLSPDRNIDRSPRIEKYVPRVDLEEYLKKRVPEREALLKEFSSKATKVPKSSPQRGVPLVPERSQQYPRSPRKDTLVPVINSASSSKTLENLHRLENNDYEKFPEIVANGISPRSGGSEGGDCELDGMEFESFSQTPGSRSEIDIDRIVSKLEVDITELDTYHRDKKSDLLNKSLDLSIEEDSFSPRSSSSPEPSLSSPEQFSSSPDYRSSPDDSFEFISGKDLIEKQPAPTVKCTNTSLNTDVYRIYLPDSPIEASSADRRRSSRVIGEESDASTMDTPRRRTIHMVETDEVERISHKHQVRRKRHNVLFEG